MGAVSINNVRKNYGNMEVLHGVSVDIADGEFVILVGPSGCGKSTLLRMIAGLEEITSGDISIGGRVVNTLAPKDRDIAMVFQSYALYPHMTVRRNITFPLSMPGVLAGSLLVFAIAPVALLVIQAEFFKAVGLTATGTFSQAVVPPLLLLTGSIVLWLLSAGKTVSKLVSVSLA